MRNWLKGKAQSAAYAGLLTLSATLMVPVSVTMAHASEATVSVRYDAYLMGLHVGRFRVQGRFSAQNYSINGQAKNRSVSRWLTKLKGETSTSGRVRNGRFLPSQHKLDIRTDDRRHRVEFNVRNDSVTKLRLDPPAKTGTNRVPVKSTHKRGVLDPISAMVFPLPTSGAITGKSACDRRVPIFDGYYRYDLVLRYKRTENVAAVAGSRSARLFVCQVLYVPVAGHKPEGRSNKFWSANRGIEIWLAPIVQAGIFMPYKVALPTPIGAASLVVGKIKITGENRRTAAR